MLADHGEKLEAAKALWDTLQTVDKSALPLINKSMEGLLKSRLASNPSLAISCE